VFLDGKRIACTGFKKYIELYFPKENENPLLHYRINDR
jgi:hypothetical protein